MRMQKMVRNVWDNRNEELQNKEESKARQQQHEDLNQRIETIFTRKQQLSNRCMSHNTAIFFKRNKHTVKSMTIKRKNIWVNEAEEILIAYDNQSEEALRFSKYLHFRPHHQPFRLVSFPFQIKSAS